jgi:hypothetical protein
MNLKHKVRISVSRPKRTSEVIRSGSREIRGKLMDFLFGENVKDPREHLTYYDQTMEQATDDYLYYCIGEYERLSQFGKPLMIVEQRVKYEEYVPGGSGSADCLIIGNGE